MSAEYAPTIELVPDATGGFVPDFNVKPRTAAPIVPYVDPASLNEYPEPPTTPRYDSGSRGLSDSDLGDFGTDEYGRPVVRRNPVTGKAEFNPDLGFSPGELDAANRSLDSDTGTRGRRRRTGAAVEALGALSGALEDAQDLLAIGSAADALTRPLIADPIADAISGPIIGFLDRNFPGFRQDWLGAPGLPSGEINVPGAGDRNEGQCEGVMYRVTVDVTRNSDGQYLGRTINASGPIRGVVKRVNGTNESVYLLHGVIGGNGKPGEIFITASGNPLSQPTISSLVRLDGEADDCGDRGPGLQPVAPAPAPTLPREPSYPGPDYGIPEDPFNNPGTELPPGTGQPDTGLPPGTGQPDTGNPPDDYPPGIGDPETPELPETPDLPEMPDQPDQPDPPTPDPDCCPSTERSLDDIKRQLEEILNRLEGSGDGSLDLSPCETSEDENAPTEATYEGEGIQGLYAAIAAITQSLNLIHTDTKCPPDVNAALPMFWEVKRGEIPQLVVAWVKAEGGNSKWSMTIPHPREDITSDYPFNFPTYRKGGNMASVKLTDNSQVIVNAFSEGEAQRVIDYIETLIDPAFIPSDGLKMVYSKNVANLVEVDVTASYVKKFAGHKNTAPLWGVNIASA